MGYLEDRDALYERIPGFFVAENALQLDLGWNRLRFYGTLAQMEAEGLVERFAGTSLSRPDARFAVPKVRRKSVK